MNKIQVLLIGIGGYGAFYLKEFLDKNNDSVSLAGVADPFAASSPRLGELEKRGIPIFADPEEFYASGGRADLAIIASPIHTHYTYTLACFRRGSNVLCEKPVTGDLAKLDELIAREAETGLFAAVGFQLSFSANVQRLKADIMGGLFGKALTLKTIALPRRGTKYYRRNSWAGKLAVRGENILDSPLNNACSHELHNMLFLLGDEMNSSAKVTSLEAQLWQARPDIENYDAASLRARTAGGTEALFYTAHCVDESVDSQGEFIFEKAVIRWKKVESLFTAHFNDGGVKVYDDKEKSGDNQKLYDVLESVRTGRPPLCTLKTARSHLECVVRAQEFPIEKAAPEKLGRGNSGDDDFYYLPGLREAFLRSYEAGVLPRETGFAL